MFSAEYSRFECRDHPPRALDAPPSGKSGTLSVLAWVFEFSGKIALFLQVRNLAKLYRYNIIPNYLSEIPSLYLTFLDAENGMNQNSKERAVYYPRDNLSSHSKIAFLMIALWPRVLSLCVSNETSVVEFFASLFSFGNNAIVISEFSRFLHAWFFKEIRLTIQKLLLLLFSRKNFKFA